MIFPVLSLFSMPLFGSDTANEALQQKIATAINKVYARTQEKAKPWIQAEYFVSQDEQFPIMLTEQEWKVLLSGKQYHILREAGTERSFSGEYDKFYQKGTYYSAATGQALYSSQDKYDSKTGWPSFSQPISANAVKYRLEKSFWGTTRIEVIDSLSGSHLGHVFDDGPPSTGLRYCMNSVALIFVPDGQAAPKTLSQK